MHACFFFYYLLILLLAFPPFLDALGIGLLPEVAYLSNGPCFCFPPLFFQEREREEFGWKRTCTKGLRYPKLPICSGVPCSWLELILQSISYVQTILSYRNFVPTYVLVMCYNDLILLTIASTPSKICCQAQKLRTKKSRQMMRALPSLAVN